MQKVLFALLLGVTSLLVAPRSAFASVVAPATRGPAGGALYLAAGGKAGSTELPLERTDVDVEVAGSVASGTVTQRFKNPHAEPIEVVYAFPLPQRAAVDAMEMKIGARTVTASIARREEARTAYANAVREGRRAALLEQERPNIFTFSVGNIDPGATIDVRLHYFEVAAYDHGTYELVVPTTIGPRFIPGDPLGGPQSGSGTKKDTDAVPDASRITPGYGRGTGAKLGVHVRIDGGSDLESVVTPSYATDIDRPSPRIADVRLKTDSEIPNRDFVLRWRLAAETFKPALFAHRARSDASGYLTLMLEPKHDVAQPEIAPRELVFLVDTSGSMQGPPLGAAIKAIHRAIDGLGPSDTFQIIDFADRASTFAPAPLKNTPDNRAKAHQYVDHLRASGGTNQLAGIHAALSMPGEESRIRYVMFMTDGFIGNDAEVIALARKEIGRARIFSFGVGSSVNRYLLDEVAVAGRGYAEYMDPRSDGPTQTNELVERFYRRIGMPYLTEIEIDWGGLAVTDMRPGALPDLSALQPLVVHARYARGGAADVTIRGKVGGKPHAQKVHVVLPDLETRNVAISRLWARETISDLERKPRGVPVDAEAITRVALAHDLLSKYTAFIATDSSGPRGASGSPILVKQPNEAPQDVDLASAGGVVTHAAGDSPAPRADSERYTLAVEPGRGGCAGCTSAPSSRTRPALFATLALLGLVAFRRRRV